MLGGMIGSALGGAVAGPVGLVIGKFAGGISEHMLKEVLGGVAEKLPEAVGGSVEEFVASRVEKLLGGAEHELKEEIGQDLQTTFRDAVRQAIYDIGSERCFQHTGKREGSRAPDGVAFFTSVDGCALWSGRDQMLAKDVCNLLRRMEKDVQDGVLLPIRQFIAAHEAAFLPYLHADTPEALVNTLFDAEIEPYLKRFEGLLAEIPALRPHLRRHLLDRSLAHFAELLDKRPTASWQAFNRLILDELRSEMRKVREGHSQAGQEQGRQEPLPPIEQWSAAVAKLLEATGKAEDAQNERLDDLLALVVKQHSELLEKLDRIEFRVTRADMNGQTAVELLRQVLGVLRVGSGAGFTVEANRVVARSHAVSAMLRDRQANYFKRYQLFAGRDRELGDIRRFLQTHSRGHVFVTAASGFGKTALLANLIKAEPDRYIWYFLNQYDSTFSGDRSNTRRSFLRQMCEQLLAYYQAPVQSESDLPTEEDRLEALYSKLLGMELVRPDRPLVLVIDGIDEAENDFITDRYIPPELPDGKFIIFSARQTTVGSGARNRGVGRMG